MNFYFNQEKKNNTILIQLEKGKYRKFNQKKENNTKFNFNQENENSKDTTNLLQLICNKHAKQYAHALSIG